MPKIGTTGERYRIKQLNYQLPKQDIDYAYCKHVGLDRECFEEFVTARNEIALDIGMFVMMILFEFFLFYSNSFFVISKDILKNVVQIRCALTARNN